MRGLLNKFGKFSGIVALGLIAFSGQNTVIAGGATEAAKSAGRLAVEVETLIRESSTVRERVARMLDEDGIGTEAGVSSADVEKMITAVKNDESVSARVSRVFEGVRARTGELSKTGFSTELLETEFRKGLDTELSAIAAAKAASKSNARTGNNGSAKVSANTDTSTMAGYVAYRIRKGEIKMGSITPSELIDAVYKFETTYNARAKGKGLVGKGGNDPSEPGMDGCLNKFESAEAIKNGVNLGTAIVDAGAGPIQDVRLLEVAADTLVAKGLAQNEAEGERVACKLVTCKILGSRVGAGCKAKGI